MPEQYAADVDFGVSTPGQQVNNAESLVLAFRQVSHSEWYEHDLDLAYLANRIDKSAGMFLIV